MKKNLGIIVFVVLIIAAVIGLFAVSEPQSAKPAVDQKIHEVEDQRLTLGDPNAPVSIVEYADVLCPYCAKIHDEVMPQLKEEYIDTGKARFEIRLVAMISPDSQRAAEGAYCAAEQDMFWDYMDAAYTETWDDYYSKGKKPTDVDLFSEAKIGLFADRAGLEILSWQDCVDSGEYANVLQKNVEDMVSVEAYGTPYFLINEQSYSGAAPYSVFQKLIDAELNKKGIN